MRPLFLRSHRSIDATLKPVTRFLDETFMCPTTLRRAHRTTAYRKARPPIATNPRSRCVTLTLILYIMHKNATGTARVRPCAPTIRIDHWGARLHSMARHTIFSRLPHILDVVLRAAANQRRPVHEEQIFIVACLAGRASDVPTPTPLPVVIACSAMPAPRIGMWPSRWQQPPSVLAGSADTATRRRTRIDLHIRVT